MSVENIDRMLEINKEQKEYYEFDTSKHFKHGGNVATRMWDKIRDMQYRITDDLDLIIRFLNCISIGWVIFPVKK